MRETSAATVAINLWALSQRFKALRHTKADDAALKRSPHKIGCHSPTLEGPPISRQPLAILGHFRDRLYIIFRTVAKG